ncbi:hypothetical protein ACWKXN_19625 [Enterobacter sp. UPMP2060]
MPLLVSTKILPQFRAGTVAGASLFPRPHEEQKMPENTSGYISIIAMIIALTAVLASIHTWRRAKRYKMIFNKLKHGDELDDKEILLLQKLRIPARK